MVQLRFERIDHGFICGRIGTAHSVGRHRRCAQFADHLLKRLGVGPRVLQIDIVESQVGAPQLLVMTRNTIGVEKGSRIRICRRLSVHRKRTDGKQEKTVSIQIAKPAVNKHPGPSVAKSTAHTCLILSTG